MTVERSTKKTDELLRSGEAVVREDLVLVNPRATAAVGDDVLFRMTISTERIIWCRLREAKYSPMWMHAVAAPFSVDRFTWRDVREPPWSFLLGLQYVSRLWKWTPEFSGRPMIQTTDHAHTGIYFTLLAGELPNLHPAELKAVREHFEALEAAWLAARGAAPADEHLA